MKKKPVDYEMNPIDLHDIHIPAIQSTNKIR